MPAYGDIDDAVTELDKRQSVHEAVCAERYEKIVSTLEEMKTTVGEQGRMLSGVASTLTERTGSGRAARELAAYLISLASILAALYSASLAHAMK